jgi:hypothetical protein
MKQMGGDLALLSSSKVGSTFAIILPTEIEAAGKK